MSKTAIILGGGHNGLVCAAYLARAGCSVTLLERRPVLGGAAVTGEFVPGFRNSLLSYTVSLLHPRVIAELNLHRHGLEILRRPLNNYLPLPNGDSFAAHSDPAAMAAEISRFSSADAAAFRDYQQMLSGIVPVMREIMTLTPPVLHGGGLRDLFRILGLGNRFRRLPGEQKRFIVNIFARSAGEMLDDTFESEPLKALLGFDAIVGNYASPYNAGSGYVLLHHLLGEVNGESGAWGHAVGGMGAVSDAIARECRALGVTLKTASEVQRIHVENGRVSAVELVGGEVFPADIFASGLHPKLLFIDLLDAGDVDPEIRHHFSRYKSQSGTFRMNVALSELPRFETRPVENLLKAGIIMAPSLEYMDQAYVDARSRGWSVRPVVEMLVPSTVDDSLAPPGQHVASLFCQHFDPSLGRGWRDHSDAAAASIIDTVNGYAPNFRASILGMQMFSPFDLEQEFGLVGGDIFHGRLSLEQLFSNRPMLGMGHYRSHLPNLYLCGSGSHPGGGVSGIPGMNAAREIIRRERL